jgi:hypothetical protein
MVELFKLLPVLPLRHFPPTLGIDRHVRQAMGIFLGPLSSLALLCKITLKEGDLSDKAFCILTSRG